VKSAWDSEPVGELCEFISGLWKGEKPPFVRVAVYRNTNFTKNGTLDDGDVAELDVEARQYAKRKLQYGDIILEKSGGGPKQPVGRVALFDKRVGEYSLSNFTSAMRVREPKRVDFQYLHRFLFWQHLSGVTESMQKRSTGIRNLTGDAYKAISVPLPPLAEQQRIVGILDEAFAAIATAKANAEKNLQNARAVFESSLSQAFGTRPAGWTEAAIAEHIRFIDYRGKTPVKLDSGLRLITAKNVKMGFVQPEPMEFVAAKSYDGWMTRGIPKKGDVLFTTEAPLANVAQLDTDDKVVFAQRIIIMQADAKKLDSTFLKYLLMSPPIQARIRAKGTGATVQGIKARLLKAIKIEFPTSLPDQRSLAARLDSMTAAVDELEVIYDRKLAALDALKESLLHHAFTGQLRETVHV